MRALHTAASGMLAQEMNVEVISNNIANMRTTGFKRQRAEFQDMLYQSLRRTGAESSDAGTVLPTGVQIGSGVRLAATARIMTQGPIEMTEKEYDVAVQGEGYFVIDMPDGRTAYTRDGSFELDPNGRLVTAEGYAVSPAITLPPDAHGISISAEGVVQALVGNDNNPQDFGQITLARFVNKSGLDPIGNNLFLESDSSGPPQIGNPGQEGYGSLLQNHLEAANVNAVSEISDLIAAQRAYEMNSRVVRAADEMLSATANLRS